MKYTGPADPLEPECVEYEDDYADLANVRILAVVFTGRGSRMQALLPYLRRDMKFHGGVLDGIFFALIRPDASALQLVQRMAAEYGDRIRLEDFTESSTSQRRNRMAALYTSCNDTSAVYIKAPDT